MFALTPAETALSKLFDTRLSAEPIGLKVVRRTILTVAAVHFSLAAISGYRAWVQVKELTIRTGDEILGPGSSIEVDAVSSGRNPVTISLDAVQGPRMRRLARVTVPENRNRFYDPRSQRERFVVLITPEILKDLKEGPLVLRATGEGRSQFLRVPPPKIVHRATAVSWTEATPADIAQANDDTMCIAAKIGLPCG
jgi:hypothetical protein